MLANALIMCLSVALVLATHVEYRTTDSGWGTVDGAGTVTYADQASG